MSLFKWESGKRMKRIVNLFKKLLSSSSGTALTELAILLPIISLVGMISIDIANIFSINQRLNMISRESANFISRDCITLADYCLSEITNQAAIVLPGSELVISVYQIDGASVITRSGVYPSTGQTASGKITKYNPSTIAANVTSLNSLNKTVVISEVFYKHNPVVGFSILSKDLYESAIF